MLGAQMVFGAIGIIWIPVGGDAGATLRLCVYALWDWLYAF